MQNNISKSRPTGSFPPIKPKDLSLKVPPQQPVKKATQHGIPLEDLLKDVKDAKDNPFNFDE